MLQRIRELEDRIDWQKRQIKDIEEKVYTQIIFVSSLEAPFVIAGRLQV